MFECKGAPEEAGRATGAVWSLVWEGGPHKCVEIDLTEKMGLPVKKDDIQTKISRDKMQVILTVWN